MVAAPLASFFACGSVVAPVLLMVRSSAAHHQQKSHSTARSASAERLEKTGVMRRDYAQPLALPQAKTMEAAYLIPSRRMRSSSFCVLVVASSSACCAVFCPNTTASTALESSPVKNAWAGITGRWCLVSVRIS